MRTCVCVCVCNLVEKAAFLFQNVGDIEELIKHEGFGDLSKFILSSMNRTEGLLIALSS